MTRYSKGNYKQDIILYNAKTLLYNKGVAGTTMREIAEMTEDPVSLVHYYFKKKEDIVRQVYHNFLGQIDLFVYSLVPDADTRILFSHTLNQLIYYDIIINDPRNLRLYVESLSNQSNAVLLNAYVDHVYRKILDEFDLSPEEDIFQAAVSMDFGARRELFSRHYNGEIHLSVIELCSCMVRTFPLAIGLPQETVNRTIHEAIELYKKLDFSHLKFLI